MKTQWMICFIIFFQLELTFANSKTNSSLNSIPVGQLLMLGFNEKNLSPELIKHLKFIRPGAIILFRRNIENPLQLKKLITQLHSELNPEGLTPILIAIDQEGGNVFRIPTIPRIPSAAVIGNSKDENLAQQYGYIIGKILRQNGISMNLAPVLDVESPKLNSFIGSRSFGDDAGWVARLGYLFSKGLASAGVIPTGKHFPGIGSVNLDPHLTTPESNLEWYQDWNKELLPFREFSRLTPSALMLSHVIYPKLDQKRNPASISPYIIKKVLRETLNYKGLVITDDLLMDGITKKLSPNEAAIESLKAGADLIMLSWSKVDQIKVFQGLSSSISSGLLDINEIQAKINHVQQIKHLLRLNEMNKEINSERAFSWNSPELARINQKLLEKILELGKNRYKKISSISSIYLLNLSHDWLMTLKSYYPQKALHLVTSVNEYKKASESEKKSSVLIIGVKSKKSLLEIENLSDVEKSSIILVVTSDININNKNSFYSVFEPKWPFENLVNKIIQYL